VVRAILDLEANPRPHGSDTVEGQEEIYRIWVGRDDRRVLYSIEGERNELVIEAVRKRDEGTYRRSHPERPAGGMNHCEIVSVISGVADLIRDTFKRGKYRDVILPLTALRRHAPGSGPTASRSRHGEWRRRRDGRPDARLHPHEAGRPGGRAGVAGEAGRARTWPDPRRPSGGGVRS
jgi:mRNA-degrading endonuclease RelE of RelBE toxin-antitoxin system